MLAVEFEVVGFVKKWQYSLPSIPSYPSQLRSFLCNRIFWCGGIIEEQGLLEAIENNGDN